jgi:hypothetical protein
MIRCKLSHLEARCRERGYTLDEARPCVVAEDGDQITVDENHESYPREPKPSLTIMQKVANFAASAASHIACGMPMATDEQVAERFSICQSCERFDGKACRECGCPVVRERQFISKLSWANEKCPLGRWGPVPGRDGQSPKTA